MSWIRIRRIPMFLDTADPDPPIFCTDPDLNPNPDPSINKQKSKKKILQFCNILEFSSMKIDFKIPSKSSQQKNFEKNLFLLASCHH
jgi:hypothetical protein